MTAFRFRPNTRKRQRQKAPRHRATACASRFYFVPLSLCPFVPLPLCPSVSSHIVIVVWLIGLLDAPISWPAEIRTNTPCVLQTVFPMGCRRGTSTEISLAGTNLTDAEALIFSHAGIKAVAAKERRFQVTVDRAVPAGDYDVWALTPDGLSNPRRFIVGDTAEVNENDNNETPETAQEVPLPGTVNARLDRTADVDCFKFRSEKGQHVTVRCRSRSLDGSVAPALSLIAPNGEELLHSQGHALEPVMSLKLPDTGTYIVRVVDRSYRRDAFSFYRLSFEVGPRLLFAFPQFLKQGSKSRVTLYGYELPGGTPVEADSPDGLGQLHVEIKTPLSGEADGGGWVPVSEAMRDGFRYRHPGVTGQVRFLLTGRPVVVEVEDSNNRRETAQAISIPCEIAGRFFQPRDLDWYRFSAGKGETLWIESFGDRLGSRMDLDVAIHDANGKAVASLPDFKATKVMPAAFPLASLDAAGSWKAPAEGEYRLVVRDLYGVSLSGPRRRYQLSLSRSSPTFQTFAVPSFNPSPRGLTLPTGGCGMLQLVVVRGGGFDGPIRVRAEKLPAGITARESWIPAGTATSLFSLTAATDSTNRTAQIRLVAEAEISGRTVSLPVRAATVVRGGTPVVTRLANGIRFGSGKALPFGVHLALTSGVVQAGSPLEITVKVTRQGDGLQGPIKLAWQSLPGNTAVNKASLAAEDETVVAELSTPQKLKPGWYTIALKATGTLAAETAAQTKDVEGTASNKKSHQPVEVTVWSNTVSFQVAAPQDKKN